MAKLINLEYLAYLMNINQHFFDAFFSTEDSEYIYKSQFILLPL